MINLHLDIFIPVMLSVIAHEIGHAAASNYLGDPTARFAGRLTLNPIRHSTLIGTVLLPLATLLLFHGKFLFGWAKPVPVNVENFRDPRRGMLLVALAGPAVNLALAISFFMVGVFLIPDGSKLIPLFSRVIGVNIALLVINLLPIPPLDGSHVARYLWGLLKQRFSTQRSETV